jgi:AraC-like DNA-binding protein
MYEVAQMVGYANAEHFNRIFRKEVGMSPHHYRNDQISEDTTTKSVDKSGESPGETDETSRIVT